MSLIGPKRTSIASADPNRTLSREVIAAKFARSASVRAQTARFRPIVCIIDVRIGRSAQRLLLNQAKLSAKLSALLFLPVKEPGRDWAAVKQPSEPMLVP